MNRIAAVLLPIGVFVLNACTDSGVVLSRSQNSSLSTSVPIYLQGGVESRLRLLPREFVANTLDLTFGPSATATVNNLIRAKSSQFGGPCEYYRGDCSAAGESQLPQVPVGTSGRYGYMTRACDQITLVDVGVLFAVRLAVQDPTLLAVNVTPPDAAAIEATFQLFYQDRSSSSEVAAELAALIRDAAVYGAFEQWRYLLLTLCLSPGWQIL